MNDLEQLKSLLFGAEKETLDSLNDRVRQPETRTVDVADVLPEALRLSHQKGAAFVTELRGPVEQCLKTSFQETPQEYANVLYPIMGPAIRKSIAQALKAFAQQINQTMEYSLSAKGLSWRFQALRSGVPFSDFVMQRTLQYRVEQAYLISRENGLLMAHVHHEASRIKDSDAVSAMFTAIQDFVKESFSPDPNSRLETADMGEFTLWAVHGPHALMVCVIRGVPPRTLRTGLSAILERIHFRYSDALRTYAGDTATVAGVEEELNAALGFQAQQEIKDNSRKLWAILVIAIVILISLLGYYGYERWQRHQEITRLETVAANTPGIYVGSVSYADGQYRLQGLRDPLAAGTEHIAEKAGMELDLVTSDFRPYQSLDPEIVFLRGKAILDPPETVSLSVLDGRLLVAGSASRQWIDRLETLIDTDRVGMPVTIDSLSSTGDEELEIFAEELTELTGTEFYFSEGTKLVDADVERLQQYTEALKAAVDKASQLGVEIDISVLGYTDSTGTTDYNAALSKARALVVVNALVATGVDIAQIQIQGVPTLDPLAEPNSEHRSALVIIKYLK